MKILYLLFLMIFIYSGAYSQEDSIKKYSVARTTTSTVGRRLDTNEVVYDEQGKALHYYQYQRLLNSGQYTFRLDGMPGSSNTKRYLKRLSVQEQNRMYDVIKERMAIKSPLLKENTELDVAPFTSIVPARQLENKVVVLIFWNTECPPCTESFADINDFLKQIHNPEDLIILAITSNTKQEATAKLKEKPLLYAQLISNAGSIFNAYQLYSYPSYVVTDKKHTIRCAITGSSQISLPAFKSTIQEVLLQ